METCKIYSKRCWVEKKLQPATVCFNNGLITEIHFEKLADAEDVENAVLMPGVIDAHVHINEPGRTEWEGFDTATQAAAAGGITTIVDMPLNASPVTTTVTAFNEKLKASENKLNVNVGFYGGLVPGNKNNLEALMQAGVLGIKCFLIDSGVDEFPNVGEKEINEAMPIIVEKRATKEQRTIKVFEKEKIQLLRGPYGPYIKQGLRNYKIPKEKQENVEGLELPEIKAIIEEVKANPPKRVPKKKKSS